MKGMGQEVEGQGKGNNMKTNSERNNNPFQDAQNQLFKITVVCLSSLR